MAGRSPLWQRNHPMAAESLLVPRGHRSPWQPSRQRPSFQQYAKSYIIGRIEEALWIISSYVHEFPDLVDPPRPLPTTCPSERENGARIWGGEERSLRGQSVAGTLS